jgi:hypothetical protein
MIRGLAGAAATYLGITPSELRSELRGGKTLAQIATAHGKTADGLVDALVAAAKTRLDKAVAAGRLSGAEEQNLLERLRGLVTGVVNGSAPAPPTAGPRAPFGFRPGPPRPMHRYASAL